MIEIDPTYAFGYDRLGRAYLQKGMYSDAIAAFEMAVKYSGNNTHKGQLGRAYAVSGRRNDAKRILEDAVQQYPRNSARPLAIAMIYEALGYKEEALHWLEEAIRVRDGNMVLLQVLPEWDSLRDDPQFKSMLRQMNFP